MATELEELIIKLDADLDDLKRHLKEGGQVSEKETSKMSKGLDNVSKSLQKGRTEFNKWGKVAIASFTAATAAIVRGQLKQVDSLAKTSDKLGVQTKELVGLQHAAELTGNSAEMFNTALQRMTRRASEAAKGTGVMVGTLQELNIDAQEFAALSPDQQFVKLSEAFGGVASQGDRVRLAMQAFDTEGVSLVNTMALGAEGLREATMEAERLGLAISRTDAAQIEAANDAMTRAEAAFTGAARVLTIQFAPIIEELGNRFTEASLEGDGLAGTVEEGFQKGVAVVGVFADGLHGIEIIFKALEISVEGWALLAQQAFKNVSQAAIDVQNKYREFRGLDPLEDTTISIDKNLESVAQLKAELTELVSQPLPSEGIKQTLAEITQASKASAEAVAKARQDAVMAASGGSPGDGGASGVTGVEGGLTEQEKLDQIAIQNELEAELMRQKFANEQTILDEALANKLITEEEFLQRSSSLQLAANRQKEVQERDHQNRLLRAQKFGELQRLNSFLKTNSDTLRAAASFSSDSFEITKKLDLASAVVDTAAGVAAALRQGPSGIPAAAAIAIKGAAQIKAIRGTSLGGAASVPGVGAATPPPTDTGLLASSAVTDPTTEEVIPETPAIQNRRTVVVELPESDTLLTTEQVRNLLDQIAESEPNLQIETT